MYGDASSEGGPKGSFENFKAEGDVLFKQGECKKALESFNTVCQCVHSNGMECHAMKIPKTQFTKVPNLLNRVHFAVK